MFNRKTGSLLSSLVSSVLPPGDLNLGSPEGKFLFRSIRQGMPDIADPLDVPLGLVKLVEEEGKEREVMDALTRPGPEYMKMLAENGLEARSSGVGGSSETRAANEQAALVARSGALGGLLG
jgi:hypothetical protein